MTLRSWFVAFGIGGPAFFLVNDSIAKSLRAQGSMRLVATLFLVGAGAQILIAFLNKVANWYVYWGLEEDPSFTSKRRYKVSEWLVEQFGIDIALDLITIGCFGYATWLLVTVFAAPPPLPLPLSPTG